MLRARTLSILAVVMALALAACGTDLANEPQSELTTQACVDGWPVTKQSDNRSADTMTAQKMLRERGYNIEADGKFGPATEAAVKAFQKKAGLEEDGKIGPNTWGKLIIVLKKDSKGELVKHLQAGLGLDPDGNYGPDTERKVIEFQNSKGLSPDGKVGPQTWKALLNACGDNGGGASGSPAELAKEILRNGNITFNTNPRQSMEDAAGGRATATGNGKSVNLSPTMLKALLSMAQSHSFRITSLTTGKHSSTSDHYKGQAVDIGTWDGIFLGSPNSGHTAARNACLAVGATYSLNAYNDKNHQNHVHCSFN